MEIKTLQKSTSVWSRCIQMLYLSDVPIHSLQICYFKSEAIVILQLQKIVSSTWTTQKRLRICNCHPIFLFSPQIKWLSYQTEEHGIGLSYSAGLLAENQRRGDNYLLLILTTTHVLISHRMVDLLKHYIIVLHTSGACMIV